MSNFKCSDFDSLFSSEKEKKVIVSSEQVSEDSNPVAEATVVWNYETENVALWMNNDYAIYTAGVDFMRTYTGENAYKDFIEYLGLDDEETPDKVEWMSNSLDYSELNDLMKEIFE